MLVLAKIVRCPRLPFAQVISEAIEPDALVEQNREGQERRRQSHRTQIRQVNQKDQPRRLGCFRIG